MADLIKGLTGFATFAVYRLMRRIAGLAFLFAWAAVCCAQDETATPAPAESPTAEASATATEPSAAAAEPSAATTEPNAATPEPSAVTSAAGPSANPVATEIPKTAPVAPPTTATAPAKRSWFGRILHPFGGGGNAVTPSYSNSKLRGLVVEVQVSPQPVQLSEVRSLDVRVTLINKGKRGVNLDFLNEQRIEIYLMTSAEVVLTRWSETHAFKDKPGTLLINPQEHVEYTEKISTRELTPDKVFICEAFLPKYPELRARQKFLTAP
jgi:hypothetical protein